MNILIYGLGFVGLTLATHIVSKRTDIVVYGVENDDARLQSLRSGRGFFLEPGLDSKIEEFGGKSLIFLDSDEEVAAGSIDVIFITIGTPLNDNHDGEYRQSNRIRELLFKAARCLNKDGVVCLRSTVSVGTSEALADGAKAVLGYEVKIAFCPERTAEGVALRELDELPQVIGGVCEEAASRAQGFFEYLGTAVLLAPDARHAEMVKLSNNTYRDLHFGIANVLALCCADVDVSYSAVQKLANLGYERGALPSAGYVGGPCLTKDSAILRSVIEDRRLADLVNFGRGAEGLLRYRTEKSLLSWLRRFPNPTLITGLTFKGQPATSDLRDSPAVAMVANIIKDTKQKISIHDYHADMNELGHIFSGKADLVSDLSVYRVPEKRNIIILNNSNEYRNKEFHDFVGVCATENSFIFDPWRNLDTVTRFATFTIDDLVAAA